MCTRAMLSLLVVFATTLGACDDDGASPGRGPNAMEFLSHTDYGCVANRGGIEECLEGASLKGIEAVGDTVDLWIHFEANCCPEFTETVSYEAGVLSITVLDTLYACRCICPFENRFRFLGDGAGQLRILFESRATQDGDICISGLDTTVTVP